MAARSAWSGAISIGVGSIHVRAYGLTKSAQSFTSLCSCHGQPIKQDKFCQVDGSRVARGNEVATEDNGLITTEKGVKVAQGKLVRLSATAVESISASERSKVVEIERVCPLDTVPLALSTGAYKLVPDEKVDGAEGPYGILWNGLRENAQAIVIDGWYARAGSRPTLLVVHANEDGLMANMLPYATSVKDAPEVKVEANADAAATFKAFAEQSLNVGEFELSNYTDTYEDRRAEMVQKAMNGEVIEAPDTPAATPEVPDLLSALKKSLDTDAKKPAAKPARKKAPAKSKAKAKA